MDLESPLRTLMTPVEAEVLRVLAGADTEFSAAQVHRLTDSASAFGVRKALLRLAQSGLVLQGNLAGSVFWRGNRDHLLWPAVESAVNTRVELARRLRERFTDSPAMSAYLYGSFARRSSTPESDLDVLVVYPDETADDIIADFADRLSRAIRDWTGNDGHVYNITRARLYELIGRGDPVMAEIRRDAVTLVGPRFEHLLRELGVEKIARV